MPLIDLDPIVPQPRSEGVKPTRRSYAADGTVHDEARYAELEWNSLGSATMYQALLAQFGLDTARTAEVTVYLRDSAFVFTRWNGLAVRPEVGREVRWQTFPRNVTVLIRNLEPSA